MAEYIELPCVVSHRTPPSDITITEITEETIVDMWFGEEERNTKIYLQPVLFNTDFIASIFPSRVDGVANMTECGGASSIVAMGYDALKDILINANKAQTKEGR